MNLTTSPFKVLVIVYTLEIMLPFNGPLFLYGNIFPYGINFENNNNNNDNNKHTHTHIYDMNDHTSA